ncbi:MAG: ATP-binding protein [Candidatus Sericytochromatia bacterium]
MAEQPLGLTPWPKSRRGREYLLALGALALLTLGNSLLVAWIGYWSVALLFLLGVMGLACVVSAGPALLAAALSVLVWNIFFIPPLFNLQIRSLQDLLMCLTYFVVALLITGLTGRIRLREQRLGLLYRFSGRLLEAGNRESLLAIAEEEIAKALQARVRLIPADQMHALDLADKELMLEAIAKRSPVADSHSYYVPLLTPTRNYGVIGLFGDLDQGQQHLLDILGRQLTLALEREALHETATQAQLNRISETLYDALLNSVSHELRTPLTMIQASVDNLRHPRILSQDAQRQALLEDLEVARRRLSHLVANLLDMSRLQSGRLQLNRNWCEPGDIVRAALKSLQQELAAYALEVRIPPDLPLLCADFVLIEQAVINLIHNACIHNPPGTVIRVTLALEAEELAIEVADQGKGIPPESLPHLFEKFYRVPGTRSTGTGLGLSITKGFLEVHGGRLTVANQPGGGACFTLRLPIPELPGVPAEEEDVPAYPGY